MTEAELKAKLENEIEWRHLIWDELQDIKSKQQKIAVKLASRSAMWGAASGVIVALGSFFLKTKM